MSMQRPGGAARPNADARLTRRNMMLAAAVASGGSLFAQHGHASWPDAALPATATVLVAGPSGGPLDLFAAALLPELAHGLPAGMELRRDAAGGSDGVTGANRFEAHGDPDGASALLLPGAAALAWLIGGPRARFDAARLVPVLAAVAPGVLMSRPPQPQAAAGATLRLAALRPEGTELVALLALDLLGLRAQPVFGFADPAAVAGAIADDAADAAFVVGWDVPQRVAALTALGLRPILSLGTPGIDGGLQRDPLLPAVPTLPELATAWRGTRPSGPLYEAWRSIAAAARLTGVLALPALTPATLVALWRQAALRAASQMAVQTPPDGRDTTETTVRVLACPDANRVIEPVAAADVTALFELRRWLAERMKWSPA